MKGNVKKVFQTSHQVVLMGFVGENLKKKTFITNQLDIPVNIEDTYWSENTDEAMKNKLDMKFEVVEKGEKYAVTFNNKEKFESGRYIGSLMLKTDFEKVKETKIDVRVVVTSEIMVYPDKLILPDIMIPEGTTRNFNKVLKIVATRGDSLKILKVVPSRKDIVTNVKELTPGKSFRCTVAIRPECKDGDYRGYLTFFTNYTHYEEIKVEIIGRVKVIPAGRQ